MSNSSSSHSSLVSTLCLRIRKRNGANNAFPEHRELLLRPRGTLPSFYSITASDIPRGFSDGTYLKLASRMAASKLQVHVHVQCSSRTYIHVCGLIVHFPCRGLGRLASQAGGSFLCDCATYDHDAICTYSSFLIMRQPPRIVHPSSRVTLSYNCIN